jgi:hypothetical protein
MASDPPERTPLVVSLTRWVKRISFTQEVKNLGSSVELSFDEGDLAVVCNSQTRMVERWGQERRETVGRRLFELAAARDLDIAGELPGARIKRRSNGSVEINFDDGLVVIAGKKVPTSAAETIKGAAAMDGFRIASVIVDGLGHLL